jgi:imidazolonepropionase-like amidohydrolase
MTPRFTRLVPLALIATVPVLFGAQNSAPREIVLNHVSVIDMTGRPIQRDMAVLLRGDRIAAIERAAGFNVPGARVFDLTGKFLIPGLVDMHHHLDTGAASHARPADTGTRACS